MDQLLPLVGPILLLCLFLDGISTMLGGNGFPVTRALFRVFLEIFRIAVRILGNVLTAIGNAISGAAGGGGRR